MLFRLIVGHTLTSGLETGLAESTNLYIGVHHLYITRNTLSRLDLY